VESCICSSEAFSRFLKALNNHPGAYT
jgi:hypothetical protein